MEETVQNPTVHSFASSSIHGDVSAPGQSSSSSFTPSSSPSLDVHEDELDHPPPLSHHPQQQEQEQTSVTNGENIAISDMESSEMWDDAWSCLVVLVTFWFFSSMTLILGYYGPMNLQLGPNCSRYIYANSIFVQYIKVEELAGPKSELMLYGFHNHPALDIVKTWSETHNLSIPANVHKELFPPSASGVDIFSERGVSSEYFLQCEIPEFFSFVPRDCRRSQISPAIGYNNMIPVQVWSTYGQESFVEWIQDPVYPNLTLSWNVIHGNGTILQNIFRSSTYYVAVGNLNSEEAEVQLNLRIRAVMYNTTEACYKCSLSHGQCALKLLLFRKNAAVLTSSEPEQGASDDDWYVKLSYGPRWITYFIGSGGMTVIMLLAFKMCHKFQSASGDRTTFQEGAMGSERAPLLSQKDDDLSSWGSSYDSVSHDEDDLDDWLAVASHEGKQLKDVENNNNPRRLCVICFDAPRDCFFLPCGHCAACFACGTRIAEAGTCPICRRKMKKVRKIFTA